MADFVPTGTVALPAVDVGAKVTRAFLPRVWSALFLAAAGALVRGSLSLFMPAIPDGTDSSGAVCSAVAHGDVLIRSADRCQQLRIFDRLVERQVVFHNPFPPLRVAAS